MANKFWIIVSISLALGTLVLLNISMHEYADPLVQGCLINGSLINSKNYIRLNIPGIDQINCVIIPFFKDALKVKSSQFFGGIITPLFIVAFVFGSIESLDDQRSLFVRFVPFWTFLSQILGVSVAFPLVWLPAFWSKSGQSPKVTGSKSDYISLKLITLCGLIFTGNCLSLVSFKEVHKLNWAITLFNVAPFLLPFIWMIPRWVMPKKMRQEPGNRYVLNKIKIYYFFAGLTTMYYFLSWKDFSLDGMPSKELFALFAAIPNRHLIPVAHQAALFLLIDTLGILISLFLLDFVENGYSVIKALKFIVVSIFMSPATAFLFNLIEREKSLLTKKPLSKSQR